MNNEQQTWILKPDVKINDYKVMGSEFLLTESFKLELDGEMGFAPKYLFQPLDISGLTRQVEELLQNYGARFFADYEIDRIAYKENIEAQEAGGRMESRARKEFAEQIVLLFLNQEGETK